MPINALQLGSNLLGFGTSLAGLFGADAAKRRAMQARQQALIDLNRSYDESFVGTRDANRSSLLASAGTLGDVLRQNGANLGAANANAGVYNSSAVAGANTNLAATNAALLAKQSAENFRAQQAIKAQGNQEVARYKVNFANQDIADASSNLGNSATQLGHSAGQVLDYATRSVGGYRNGAQGSTPPPIIQPSASPTTTGSKVGIFGGNSADYTFKPFRRQNIFGG